MSVYICEQLHVKTTDDIFIIIPPEMYLWTTKSLLNFESHPLSAQRLDLFALCVRQPALRQFSNTLIIYAISFILVDYERVCCWYVNVN